MSYSIWSIGDPHLSFGTPDKGMEVFGPNWEHWTENLKKNWEETISPNDLVLVPGDISWAKHIEEAMPDLEWIDRLPGTKVMIRGNHDYWWSSVTKIRKALPPSIHIIQNDVFNWNNVTIGGARLWDTPEYGFNGYIEFVENKKVKALTDYEKDPEYARKIFTRELGRLEMSLSKLDKNADLRICMTHYPPISADLKDSQASRILEKHKVDICTFGHLHNVPPGTPMFGTKNGVAYHLTSCDYLHFHPKKVYSSSS